MRVVGEAVQKCAGAGGDGVDHFLAGDDGAERGVSAGKPFGGNEDVGRESAVFDGEVAASAPHARHDFIGDEQHAVSAGRFPRSTAGIPAGEPLHRTWRR